MKICVFGGTGSLGSGLAARLSTEGDVIVASRDLEKARLAAESLLSHGWKVRGTTAMAAAQECDVAILAVPYEGTVSLLQGLGESLKDKLVISAVVPMKREGPRFVYSLKEGSAAQEVASALPGSRIAAAFHTVPATALSGGAPLDLDVPVTAETEEIYREAGGLIASIRGLRPVYAGPLASSSEVERLTPLLLNVSKLNRVPSPSLKFVSTKPSSA